MLSALFNALDTGLLRVVQELLDRSMNPNDTDKDGVTPLRRAVIQVHEDVALLLLEYGANVNAMDLMESTLFITLSQKLTAGTIFRSFSCF
jgi:ankyrin repeat protein